MAEEYCWAIAQGAGRSCCGRYGFAILRTEFHLDFLVYKYTLVYIRVQKYILNRMYTEFHLDFLVYKYILVYIRVHKYILNRMYTEFLLAPDLTERQILRNSVSVCMCIIRNP